MAWGEQAGTWEVKEQAGTQGTLEQRFLGKQGDMGPWGISGEDNCLAAHPVGWMGHGHSEAGGYPGCVSCHPSWPDWVPRDFQCAACCHGNPVPSIPAGMDDHVMGWPQHPRSRPAPGEGMGQEQQRRGSPGPQTSLQAAQDAALHTSARGNHRLIPALAPGLNGKVGQPLKSLQGYPGRQEVEGC